MRTGENIYKRKDGRWEARYIKEYDINGKAKYSSVYSKTYSQAKKIRQGIISQSNQKLVSGGDMIVQELFDLWLQSVKIKVKESTLARYQLIVKNHIIPDFGNLKLKKLNTAIVENFIIQKLQAGRINNTGGLSSKTVRDIVSVIKSGLKYAVKENFTQNINMSFSQPKIEKTEIRILTPKEQTRLVQYLTEEIDYSKIGVLICLYTGIRLGELCSLHWSDIDFAGGVLKVQRTIQRIVNVDNEKTAKTMVVIDSPKSSCSIREIPLPPFLENLLSKALKANYDDCYVLTGRADKYIEPRAYQYKFKRYLQESGIRDINFHALRHTFATRCIECNFDIKSLSEILGHSNVNITLNRYVHSSFELKRSHMDKLKIPLQSYAIHGH